MLGAMPAWASFLLFFFFSLCCRPEDREEIQTKITPVPLPEKCAPLLPPDILPALRERSQYGSWVELGMAGVAGSLTCSLSTFGQEILRTIPLLAFPERTRDIF